MKCFALFLVHPNHTSCALEVIETSTMYIRIYFSHASHKSLSDLLYTLFSLMAPKSISVFILNV